MTRTSRIMLSTIAISMSLALSTATVQAALPIDVNGQEMPSLAPILEGVTPAVVNISVSGKKVTRQAIPEQFRFFFGPNSTSRPSTGTTIPSTWLWSNH